MKRSVLLVALLSLVVSSCTYEQKERQNWRELFPLGAPIRYNQLEYFPVYGDVQKIMVFKGGSYKNFIDEDSSPDGSIAATVWFNDRGDVVESEMEYYGRDGGEEGFFEKKQYKYSSSGKILAIKSTAPSKENEYYEYDEENRLVNKRKTDGYSTYYYRYDCDSQGRKIEERSCNGEFYDKICWEYDDKGRVLEEACYDREGKRYEHMSYKYNWHGRLVEENGENCYGFTASRKYDWRGRLKCPEGCRCKYDKHGNMIAKADFSCGDTVVYRYKIVYR